MKNTRFVAFAFKILKRPNEVAAIRPYTIRTASTSNGLWNQKLTQVGNI